MRSISVLLLGFASLSGNAGCAVDVPDVGAGTFACSGPEDCVDGFVCDLTLKHCVSSTPQTCSGAACTDNACSSRGSNCDAGSSRGICAQVKLPDSTYALRCAACPTSCPATCVESTAVDKPLAQAAVCPSTTARCTDLGCPCATSSECGPTLICNTTCVDPCMAPNCSGGKACQANQNTNTYTCVSDCRVGHAKCFADATSGTTCDDASGSCIAAIDLLQVLEVQPAPETRVPANVAVRVTFNMPLDATTVTDSTFYVELTTGGRVQGTVTYPDSNTLKFSPTGGSFAAGATYQVNVVPGIRCGAGMALDRASKTTFTTF